MTSEWYQKLILTPLALNTIGIDKNILDLVSNKIHKDDVYDIAHFLGTNSYILINVLFEPCEAPAAMYQNLTGN